MDEEEKLQRIALEKCNVIFSEKLNVAAILPQLIARRLLADDEKQVLIMPSNTNGQKAQYLLDIIPRKEKGWFEQFIECLRQSSDGTGHRDLVKELETKFQELREQSVADHESHAQLESQQPVGRQSSGGPTDAREEIYSVFLESSGNHAVHTFNVRGSDSVGNFMDKVREKLNVHYTQGIRLLADSKELRLHNSLKQSNVRKNSRVIMVVVAHGGHLIEHKQLCF